MKKGVIALGTAALVALLFAVVHSPLAVGRDDTNFSAQLDSFQETPANVTAGHGTLQLRLVNPTTLQFTLTFADLEGGAAAAAHIHIGQRGVAGGVSAFFCGGGGKAACPATGTVTGTIVAADVIGPAAQGVKAGNFDKLVRALRAGVTYANIHDAAFPGGEIRGQIHAARGDD